MKTWEDVYSLPFQLDKFGIDWVYDAKGQFIFQFDTSDEKTIGNIMVILNGVKIESKFTKAEREFKHFKGEIFVVDKVNTVSKHIITIRGWGNLTGTGGHGFSSEEAANIQDTLAEWIVSKLNECFKDV